MIGSTYLIALGIVLLVPPRLSETPERLGLLVFLAALLIAAACAMHLGAMIGRIGQIPKTARAVLIATAWPATFGGAAWAMSRAPGSELVVGLMTVPPLIGIAGVAWAPADRRWHGVPFLVLAIGLALLVLPAWLDRL